MIVKPHDCIVGMTIPMERAEFERELKENPDKDFVISVCRDFDGNIEKESLWEIVYDKMIKQIQELITEIKRLGATVVPRLKFGDFQTLFKGHKVVTLVAHWRSSNYYPEDFLEPYGVLSRLKTSDNASIKNIKGHLSDELVGFLNRIGEGDAEFERVRRRLAQDLNNILNGKWVFTDDVFQRLIKKDFPGEIIDSLRPLNGEIFFNEKDLIDAIKAHLKTRYRDEYKSFVLKYTYQCVYYQEFAKDRHQPVVEYPLYRFFLNRQVMDKLFVNLIKKGSCVEFSDQLYSVNDVVDQIPENFDGTIDLTVCNSIVLGEEIKRKRRNCKVIGNLTPSDPVFRLMCYRYLLEVLDQNDVSFIDGYSMIRRIMARTLRE